MRWLTAAMFAALACVTITASGATAIYYTATTGNDTNQGTITAPFKTITAGVAHLTPGDTLYVRAGTYAESFMGNIPSGSSWADTVTVAGYPGDAAPIIQPASGPDSVFYFDGGQQYIVISGLVVDAVNCAVDAIKITEGDGGVATNIMISGCTIENAPGQGILTTDGGSYNKILNNTILNSGVGAGASAPASDYHGMYISTDHNLIQGNVCYDNPGYGIQVYEVSGTLAHDNVVCDNVCYQNAAANDGSGGGILISSGSNNQAYNNVVYGNQASGLVVDYSAVGALVANNTVYGNSAYGIYIGTGSSSATVENNIAYGDAWTPDLTDGGSTGTTYGANISGVNPGFANATAANFQLTSASVAAISTGMTVAQVTTDILGFLRPMGSYSIGAYQYNPAPGLTGIDPSSATAGSAAVVLTVTGSGFISSSSVNWNGAEVATSYVSSTTLLATVPAALLTTAGAYPITVTTPAPNGGTTAAAAFTITGTIPTLSSVSPASAAAGSGDQTITVTGTNFAAGSTVEANGSVLTTTYNSSTQLTAAIPAADLTAAGTLSITVANPSPGGGVSSAATFTISAAAPTIAVLVPGSTTAGADSMTISIGGANFITGATVNWNGVPLSTTYVSAAVLTATVPASDLAAAGTFSITVADPSPGGGVSSAATFTVYNPSPAISSLSPERAAVNSGPADITVTGSNFVAGSVVEWNGTALATTYVSSTELTATIPSSNLTQTGLYSVTVANPAPGGGASSAVNFTVSHGKRH